MFFTTNFLRSVSCRKCNRKQTCSLSNLLLIVTAPKSSNHKTTLYPLGWKQDWGEQNLITSPQDNTVHHIDYPTSFPTIRRLGLPPEKEGELPEEVSWWIKEIRRSSFQLLHVPTEAKRFVRLQCFNK